MELLGVIVTVLALLGLGATFIGWISVAPLSVWGGLAVVGIVIMIMTRRPGN